MPWCHNSNSESLLFFFSFSFVCAYECAGVQAGGYVCNYFNFIALELIGWSLSESSWFSVLLFFFLIFPLLSIMRFYFISCLCLETLLLAVRTGKVEGSKNPKQTQINPAPYNSTLEKFFWFYHCNFAHLRAAFPSRQLYQVTYLVVG